MNTNYQKKMIENITVSSFSRYLTFNDWRRISDFPNKNLLVFKKAFDDDIAQIVIPANQNFRDFKPKIQDAINTLCIYEDADLDTLLKDIVKHDVDIMEIRIISKISEKGTLPLNYASSIAVGLKDIVVSSACTEENPRPVYFRPTKNALSYANLFRFGQTDFGSFIITLESDTLPESTCVQQMIGADETAIVDCKIEEPFQRKVLKRLQKAMYQVENLGSQGNINEFIQTAFEDGINANMCDAFLELNNQDSPVQIESSFRWSNLYPNDDNIPNTLHLSHNSFYFIKAIGEAYKEKAAPQDITIQGKIKSLKIDEIVATLSNDMSGYISIEFVYENKTRTIKVYLEGDAYQKACDAHKEMKYVSVTGKLDQSTKFWHLDNPRDFAIL